MHEWWVRDSAQYIKAYGPDVPFLADTPVPFAVSPVSFFRDRDAFTAVDGLFDTSEDAVFLLSVLQGRVRAVRESVDKTLLLRRAV